MRFSDRDTGTPSSYARQAKIIHLDIDKSEINKNIPVDVPVIGDCKESLPALTKLLHKRSHAAWRESFHKYAVEEREKVIEPDIHPKDGPLLMGEVVNVVAEQTNGEAVLVNDVGQNQMISSRYFKYKRSRSIVTSGGFGTMGFGLPAAVGAAFGAPDRTVCCFMGDGGLQMSIQELGTIMEQQVPVKMILLNNNYLGNVRQWQDLMFHHRHSFTRMLNPHYQEIAAGYGIAYDVVIDRKDLKEKVGKMLSTKGPYLLECAIKEEENIVPMILPGTSVDQMKLILDC
jgi:acetolactate synthase-1/2/3 large subunit